MKRYSGLKKVTITVREDGLIDVVRERDTGNGERFSGCATLDEAFEVIARTGRRRFEASHI